MSFRASAPHCKRAAQRNILRFAIMRSLPFDPSRLYLVVPADQRALARGHWRDGSGRVAPITPGNFPPSRELVNMKSIQGHPENVRLEAVGACRAMGDREAGAMDDRESGLVGCDEARQRSTVAQRALA